MSDVHEVRSGEIKVVESPDKLIARGLGSCVAVSLYDPELNIGGMAHVMLPESNSKTNKPGKYADSAVEELLERMKDRGCKKKD